MNQFKARQLTEKLSEALSNPFPSFVQMSEAEAKKLSIARFDAELSSIKDLSTLRIVAESSAQLLLKAFPRVRISPKSGLGKAVLKLCKSDRYHYSDKHNTLYKLPSGYIHVHTKRDDTIDGLQLSRFNPVY